MDDRRARLEREHGLNNREALNRWYDYGHGGEGHGERGHGGLSGREERFGQSNGHAHVGLAGERYRRDKDAGPGSSSGAADARHDWDTQRQPAVPYTSSRPYPHPTLRPHGYPLSLSDTHSQHTHSYAISPTHRTQEPYPHSHLNEHRPMAGPSRAYPQPDIEQRLQSSHGRPISRGHKPVITPVSQPRSASSSKPPPSARSATSTSNAVASSTTAKSAKRPRTARSPSHSESEDDGNDDPATAAAKLEMKREKNRVKQRNLRSE